MNNTISISSWNSTLFKKKKKKEAERLKGQIPEIKQTLEILKHMQKKKRVQFNGDLILTGR